MKKRILLFTAIAGMGISILSSYVTGPGTNGYDCTGAETGAGNPTGCSAGASSCHGGVGASTGAIGVTIELDSAGIAKHYYTGGHTYTVKITGVNNTTGTLPKFGFQMGSIVGSAALPTPVNAGTWSATTPAGTHYVPGPGGTMGFVVNVVEHFPAALSPTTGVGGTGSTIVESFNWTAPAAGTGTISFWGAVNAVNNDDLATAADKWNTTHLVVPEGPIAAGVAGVANDMVFKAYPNPVTTNLYLQTENAGDYSVQVYDLNGRSVANEQITINGNPASFNTSNWPLGFYQLVIEKDGNRQVMQVVKQ